MGWGGQGDIKIQQWLPKETQEPVLAREAESKHLAPNSQQPLPPGHPQSPTHSALREQGNELSSKKNSKAVFHFIFKIHMNFEFHSTGYQHLFCYNNFHIIGLNDLSLSKTISSRGPCTPDTPLVFAEYLLQKFSFWDSKFRCPVSFLLVRINEIFHFQISETGHSEQTTHRNHRGRHQLNAGRFMHFSHIGGERERITHLGQELCFWTMMLPRSVTLSPCTPWAELEPSVREQLPQIEIYTIKHCENLNSLLLHVKQHKKMWHASPLPGLPTMKHQSVKKKKRPSVWWGLGG